MFLSAHGTLPSFAHIGLCSCIDILRYIHTLLQFHYFIPSELKLTVYVTVGAIGREQCY